MVIHYYSTESCRPCKAFFPVVVSVANEYGVPVEKFDLSNSPDLAESLAISSVPVVILRDNGVEEKVRLHGMQARAVVAASVAATLETLNEIGVG